MLYHGHMRTLIRNALILPMTEEGLFFKGNILIQDGKIVSAGSFEGEADEIIEAEGMIALPSFVNAHTHLAMVLMRNYKDTCEELMSWLSEIWPVEDKLVAEDIYHASRLGAAELIESGCTVFADMYFQAENTVRAAREAGIRGIIGLTFFGDGNESKRRIRELYPRIEEEIAGDPMFRADAAVHAVYTCSAETYIIAAEWAKEHGSYLHTHLSETMTEVNGSLRDYGKRPVEYLDSLGIFSVPCYLAHAVHFNQSELDILSPHKDTVSFVHNPSSNLKLASGIAPVSEYRRQGFNVALGTDGASSNNNLSMLKEINLAALAATVKAMSPSAGKPYEILKMATVNGAKALGLGSVIGTIEPGKDADIVLIDTDAVNMTPLNDPFSAVVFSADKSNIDTVLCRGRKLMERHQILTLDKEEIRAKANERWESVLER